MSLWRVGAAKGNQGVTFGEQMSLWSVGVAFGNQGHSQSVGLC